MQELHNALLIHNPSAGSGGNARRAKVDEARRILEARGIRADLYETTAPGEAIETPSRAAEAPPPAQRRTKPAVSSKHAESAPIYTKPPLLAKRSKSQSAPAPTAANSSLPAAATVPSTKSSTALPARKMAIGFLSRCFRLAPQTFWPRNSSSPGIFPSQRSSWLAAKFETLLSASPRHSNTPKKRVIFLASLALH